MKMNKPAIGAIVIVACGIAYGLWGLVSTRVEQSKREARMAEWIHNYSEKVEVELASASASTGSIPDHVLALRDPSINIEGEWAGSPGIDHGSSILIRRKSDVAYSVEFTAFGIEGIYTLNRTGQYVNAVLTLDRVVRDYFPGDIVQRFIVIKRNTSELLVPDIDYGRRTNIWWWAYHRNEK